VLRIEMLPAGNGDCLWIEYGSATNVHRILIDCGHASTYRHLRARILALPQADRVFELLIVTHVDNDHIEGVLPLLQDSVLKCRFKDIWYNGWRHLQPPPQPAAPEDVLGPKEGEFLGVLIHDARLPWNAAFENGPVVVPDHGELPRRELAGGLTLTLLSPTPDQLTALARTWRKTIEDANFQPGNMDAMRAQLRKRRYLPDPNDTLGAADGSLPGDDVEDILGRVEDGPGGSDTSEANGSSIAVLAEYNGKKALLTGDAFAGVIAASLIRANASTERQLAVDVWKLSHHGSWANFTEDLFALLCSPRYLISTDGSGHQHPHQRTLNYIIDHYRMRGRPELIFNYRCATTERWAESHPSASKFRAIFPTGAVLLV
jgi:beta-lactamase superfamily II metal-dependent hydrolase